MIPKIIHYCWFGPKPFPKQAKKCLDSWKKYFPDYQFIFWNESNAPLDVAFVQAAMSHKKWAFVADYVRTWALYTYGGIYFDTDVLVVKSFDDLMCKMTFLAYEQPEKLYVNVAVWGAEKNNGFVHEVLSVYQKTSFDLERIFECSIPMIVTGLLKVTNQEVFVLDYDSFYPFPGAKRRTGNYKKYITDNTYAVHLWDFSWLTMKERIIIHLKKLVQCLKR